MNWLNKLSGFKRAPHGLEWRLLRMMPKMCFVSTVLPALAALLARFFMTGSTEAELVRRIQVFDYLMIGLVLFVWTMILTLAIGCAIVWLMKGPAYVADGYALPHSDRPKR
jgi:hypothetical protein